MWVEQREAIPAPCISHALALALYTVQYHLEQFHLVFLFFLALLLLYTEQERNHE